MLGLFILYTIVAIAILIIGLTEYLIYRDFPSISERERRIAKAFLTYWWCWPYGLAALYTSALKDLNNVSD